MSDRVVKPSELPPECAAMIGKRAVMQGEHPWAGHSGTIDRWERTMFGIRPVVKLDNGQQAFAMKPFEMRAA